jgi:hypothetical protein
MQEYYVNDKYTILKVEKLSTKIDIFETGKIQYLDWK